MVESNPSNITLNFEIQLEIWYLNHDDDIILIQVCTSHIEI